MYIYINENSILNEDVLLFYLKTNFTLNFIYNFEDITKEHIPIITNSMELFEEKIPNYICLITSPYLEDFRKKNNLNKPNLTIDINPLNTILSYDSIPEKFNYTNLDEAFPHIISSIKYKKKGIISLYNTGYVLGEDVKKFYSIDKKISTQKIYSSTISLTDITNLFIEKDKKKVAIFIPTYYRLNKTKKCIDTIFRESKKSNFQIEIFIGDNDTQIVEMREYLMNLPKEINVYFSPKNIGKAMIINKMFSNLTYEPHYIFNIDGDMYVREEDINKEKCIFDGMIECLNKTGAGLVSSFQYGQSEHWFNGTLRIIQKSEFKVAYSPSGIGVAGGCIVMNTKDWKSIGGYKENHDIYTGDDSILTYNVKRKLNKLCLISIDYGMVHPPPQEDEKGYLEWKRDSWKRDNLSFIKDNYRGSNKKGYYDK